MTIVSVFKPPQLLKATSNVNCDLCNFSEACSVSQYFAHLITHIKRKEPVRCPFQDCSFQTSVYSTFRAHKSKNHRHSTFKNFRTDLYQTYIPVESNPESENSETHSFSPDCSTVDSYIDVQDLQDLIKHKVASLLLRMQTTLHVSKATTQEIVNELCSVYSIVQEFTPRIIESVLVKHNCVLTNEVTTALAEIIENTNPLASLSKSGPFANEYKRTNYYKDNFKVIEPVEYFFESSSPKKFVYIPILKVLTELLNRDDVLDKILQETADQSGQIKTYRDGLYCKGNPLLSSESLSIALGMYIDDYEVCNPLGTSRKKHKVCAVYWVISNLPAQYRSSVQSIYLACLSNSNDVKKYGYDAIFQPLIRDIQVLEEEGLYVQKLGTSVKGSVLYVSADNLGAHSLAGFQESFNVDKFCRFCLASRKDIDLHEVREGVFPLRTIESHKQTLEELKTNSLVSLDGVKRDCVLDNLNYFHTIQGFPPDFMHDLFEGIVPKELSLCIKSLISKRYFTLDELNAVIKSFPFKFTDKTNKPQQISKTFVSKHSIGGNCHENWTLIRLLPLMMGHRVPEGDKTWQILLELKDIIELLATGQFTDETLCYLESKISEHRCLLKECFPDFHILPKHHFLEHYSEMICRFGPLTDFWTIRFEAKHSFFKRVVHDSKNFKNVLLTQAKKHQLALAYYLDLPSVFKPDLEVGRVAVVSPDTLGHSVRKAIEHKYGNLDTVFLSTHASIYGTKYLEGMFLSLGQTSGLPDFGEIVKIIIVNNKVSFILKPFKSWYMEHLRSYELTSNCTSELQVVEPKELNGYQPLYPYIRAGKLYITPKTFLLH